MIYISVIMSVYNEKLSEISESIDSILSQSFTDFELIVVLDRPEYSEGLALLNAYSERDSRVKIIVNSKNIGLALSMNVAAEHAQGEFLLRMDADDVCYPERFRKQYEAICNSKYDLICGNYDFIDEDGNKMSNKVPIYTDKQLEKLLPYRNIIHHPTVIMRTDSLRAVGEYRNYPCAQDYDLWLRMKCADQKMHMMSDKLIKYRVRQTSTTVQKRYKQSCTGDYIRMLYRQKNNMTSYSYEQYLAFLDEHNANDEDANSDFIYNSQLYKTAKREIRQGQIFHGMLDLMKVIFKSKYYRPHFIRSIQIASIMRMR